MLNKILENGNLEVTIPVVLRHISGRKRIILPSGETDGNTNLALCVARGLRWQKYIDEGKYKNIKELARALGKDPAIIARTIRLTALSPEIIHRIIVGDVPRCMTMNVLRSAIPSLWDEQKKELLEA